MKKQYFLIPILLFFLFVSATQNESAKALFQKGVELHKQKKIAEAIKVLNEAIQADKEYLEAVFERGVCKFDLEDYRGAEADMLKALKIDERHAQSYYYIGLCYLKAEYPTIATEYFSAAVKCDPSGYNYYYYRGVAICELKSDYKFARADFEKVVELNPNHTDALIYLGNISFKFKEYQKAIEHNQKVMNIKPDYSLAHFNTAIAYSVLKDYNNSCKFFKSAQKLGYATASEFVDKDCEKAARK
jgi:tetratricopeptide (TPR) repeat protein